MFGKRGGWTHANVTTNHWLYFSLESVADRVPVVILFVPEIPSK